MSSFSECTVHASTDRPHEIVKDGLFSCKYLSSYCHTWKYLELIVEAKILPQDIGHVHIDQSADIKFASYDSSRFGSLQGTVRQISASTYLDQDQNPYYRAEVILDKNYLGENPDQLKVLPGMT
ncbi:MAG: HlyD family efflux transporter periplasmic adaptor subunit, partial [Candidatus Thiodiazotropha sp. 6PLUC5]